MTEHRVGTQQDWQAARGELLAEEKELTRRNDELARKRRELPWGAGRGGIQIAAARYADERAVARSNRSMSSLSVRSSLPYSAQAIDLVDDICADRLPDHLTQAVRQDRAEQRAALAERERIVSAARERLEAAVARAADLSAAEREQAIEDVEVVHGRYSVEGHKLRKQLEPTVAPTANDDDSAAHAA